MDYRVTCRACLTQNPRAPMFALDDGDLREIFAECAKLQVRDSLNRLILMDLASGF